MNDLNFVTLGHSVNAKLDEFYAQRYLTEDGREFVSLIENQIEDYLLQNRKSLRKRVLLFPPVSSYHRLLIHKVTEGYPQLHSFSIGEGPSRQTVVTEASLLQEEEEVYMTDPRPRPSRGRGRGKQSDRVIEVGAREATDGIIKQEIIREREDGRWQHDRWIDHDDRFDGGDSTKIATVNDGGTWKHDRWMDSDDRLDGMHDNKSGSPKGRMRRTDVEVERSSDGGKREETIGEQKTSITARPTRNRPKRPEVQRYVPRGRRLQEEAERKAGRTREDDSTQHNAESLSKSHNTTKIDTEYKRTKDEIALISSGKKMPRTREENCAQIHPQETEAKTMGDNSYQQNKNDRKDRIKGENSPRLKTERRIRKLREDNSSLKCEENVTKTSDGRLADDSGDSRSLSHVNVKPNHGSDRKKQTKGNVYVPPGRRKATSERVGNSEKEGFTLERVENSDKKIVTSKGIDNLDQEVVEMSTDNHPVLLVDKDEREKIIKEIDHADCEIKSSSYDEEECSGRQQDDMECSQKQEYGSNNKSQEIFEYDKIEMSKDEVQLADSETEEFVMCETSFDGDAAVKNVSEGYTDLRETRHVEADNQEKKMGEIEEPLSREGKDVSKEDVEEDLVSVNKKMKVECSTTPQSLEHSKTENDSVDDVNILSHDDTSAICNDHDTSMISDEKESSNLDILMTKNEDSQIHVDGNQGDNDGSVSSDLTDKICEGKLTGNESIDREAMETNETMDADDTKEMIGSDDQMLANEKQLDSSEVHEEKKEGDDKMNGQQTNVDERISDDNDEEEEDEDSWDKMFDDEGECLDPSAVEELTKKVGKVKIQKAKINYLDFKPKDPDLNYDEMGHVIEIFGFPAEFKTEDLLSIFQPYKDKGFDIKWVDDTHALGVFSSPIAAQSALSLVHPLCKVGPLTDAARASKVKAKRAVEFLQPYKPRPETSASAARRLVSGALGLSTRVSKEQREKERQKLREAKEKRKMERKQKDDIWEGTCTSSHSHDDR